MSESERDLREEESKTWREHSYEAVERLVGASRLERVLLSIIALVIAIIIGMVFVFISGVYATCKPPVDPFIVVSGLRFCYNPFKTFVILLIGSMDSAFSIALTLQSTTLLIFAGLSVAIAFRAGLFNIGTQGQMVFGALASGTVGAWLVPKVSPGIFGGIIVISGSILAAIIVGGIWGAIPGILKAYANANEVITTIMLNIIASGIAFTLVTQYINPTGNIQTDPLPSWAMFGPILAPSGSRFSFIVFFAAIVTAGAIWYLLNYSAFGYNLRVSGQQPKAADYSGVKSKQMIVSTMTISGVLGGLTGATFVLMSQGYWTDALPGFGFDGITVSVLATNSPIGVIPAALLFGVLRSGTVALQLNSPVPPQIADVLRGIIILLVAMPEFIRMLGLRAGMESFEQTHEVDTDVESEVSADD
ncbi:MAG: ABC transporter permease [Halobacteriaceae archaeon]